MSLSTITQVLPEIKRSQIVGNTLIFPALNSQRLMANSTPLESRFQIDRHSSQSVHHHPRFVSSNDRVICKFFSNVDDGKKNGISSPARMGHTI